MLIEANMHLIKVDYTVQAVARWTIRHSLVLLSSVFIRGDQKLLHDSSYTLQVRSHLVRPHLEYACEVWSPHQAYLVNILEEVQRRATKVIIKHKPYGERLKDLKLLSLVSRRKYFDLIFLFKCRQGLCDIDLSNYLEPAGNASYKLRNTELLQNEVCSNKCTKIFIF